MDLQFPRFSYERPSVWFAQVEAIYALNGVITETDKYDYVITQIPNECIRFVEDIILNPPLDNKYEHIKSELIKRLSVQRMKKEEMGNKKPSEYLMRLKHIADQRVSISTILNIWTTNLPEQVRDIVTLESSGNIEMLCEMADKVFALVSPNPQPPLNVTLTNDQYSTIINRLEELSKQVEMMRNIVDSEFMKQKLQSQQLVAQHANNALTANNHQVIQNVNSNVKPGLYKKPSGARLVCWYHTVFGDRAVACIPPCQYNLSTAHYLY